METLSDPVTFQRTTADWPRSIEEGSTVNSAITGRPAEPLVLGAVDPPAVGGGGGGGIGVFLPPHADAIRIKTTAGTSESRKENLFIITRRNYLTPHTGDLFSPCVVSCLT
jgi:hypothetical protein